MGGELFIKPSFRIARALISLLTIQFLQTFLADEKFEKFKGREFVFACESYGGHYGPIMTSLARRSLDDSVNS